MSLYEISFIARQDFSKKQVDNITSNINNILQKDSNSIEKIEYCGLRPLAYPIKNNKRGHYVIIYIDTEKNKIENIKRILHINEDLLRYIILSSSKHPQDHSALYQQSKSFRESNIWDIKRPGTSNNENNYKQRI